MANSNNSKNVNDPSESEQQHPPKMTNSDTNDQILAIQWNINGLRARQDELLLIVLNNPPVAIALQETRNKDNSFLGSFLREEYIWFNRVDPVDSRMRGVALGILKKFDPIPVKLGPSIPAVAASIRDPCEATLVSLYIGHDNITCQEVEDILTEIDRASKYPLVMLGDFNAHHEEWGSAKADNRGKTVLEYVVDHNLVVINSGEATRMNPANGNLSSIDLSIVSSEIACKLDWSVHNDSRGSDHFPIMVSLIGIRATHQTKRRQWRYNVADWKNFEKFIDMRCDGIESVEEFSGVVRSGATKFIPRTSEKVGKKSVCWWTTEVKQSVKYRRKMLRKVKKLPDDHPDRVNAVKLFQLARNNCRRVIRKTKKECWEDFVHSFNPDTPVSLIWRKVNNLSGKKRGGTPTLRLNDRIVDNPKEIANALADHLEKVYAPEDLLEAENSSGTQGQYNSDISMSELLWAIDQGKGQSVGPDLIGYPMLQHLPYKSKVILLKLINQIWDSGKIPEEWKESVVVPLPKPGKDPKILGNQRPISLMSCVGKTVERIINRRLVEVLESNNLLDPRQYAFRQGRGIDLYLVDLEANIDEAIVKKQHSELAVLDISKAYDCISNKAIFDQLVKWGVSGRLLNYVRDFLKQRFFRIAVGGTLSERKKQTNGVPQGSVLAVTLFVIGMDSIFSKFPKSAGARVPKIFVYADDIVILVSGLNQKAVRKALQKAIIWISEWARSRGLLIAAEKSKLIHICTKSKHSTIPDIVLNGNAIPTVNNLTVLGVTLNSRFTFRQHAITVKKACNNRINLLRNIGHHLVGGSRKTLLYIGKAMIIPKIFHGWGLVSRDATRVEKVLEPVYNSILRISSGAFCTSPVVSLCAESGELPFGYLASLKLIAKVSKLEEKKMFSNVEGVWPISIRARSSYETVTGEELQPVAVFPLPLRRRWSSAASPVDWSVKVQFKVGEAASKARTLFSDLEQSKYAKHKRLFTDGSVDEAEGVGLGIVGINSDRSIRIPNGCTVFSAEAKALLLALRSVDPEEEVVVFTDSASCVSAIESNRTNHPWIRAVQLQLEVKKATVCWIPGHVGIAGNEKADGLANIGRTCEVVDEHMPAVDRIQQTRKKLEQKWENCWYRMREVKLRKVKPSTAAWSDRPNRLEQSVLTRLRIGHTKITHEHLLDRNEVPQCQYCGTPVTVEHLLINCRAYDSIREELEMEANIGAVLCYGEERERKVIEFLKKTDLLYKI